MTPGGRFRPEKDKAKKRGRGCFFALFYSFIIEMTGAAVARRLKMGKSAVSRAVVRGEKVASDMKRKLFED